MGHCVRLVAGGRGHRRRARQGHRRQDGRPNHDDNLEHVVEPVNHDYDDDPAATDLVDDDYDDDDYDYDPAAPNVIHHREHVIDEFDDDDSPPLRRNALRQGDEVEHVFGPVVEIAVGHHQYTAWF